MTDHDRRLAEDLATAAFEIGNAVLCRVWLMGPGDLCSSCSMASECQDRRTCLHLAASVGLTRRVDGPFRRFPFGAHQVGRVARTLEPFVLADSLDSAGVADAAWLVTHRIESFGAFPIHSAGKCLGVLALFTRESICDSIAAALAALGRLAAQALVTNSATSPTHAPRSMHSVSSASSAESMADAQSRAILAALARTGGKLSGPGGAAEILGMKPTTLESRIRRLGLRKPPRLRLR